MRLRSTMLAAFGVLALAGPAFAATPTPDCHALILDDADGDQALVSSALPIPATVAIDIDDVFLTGAPGAEQLNIRLDDLTASPNTEYRFGWADPVNFGYSWRLDASFLTAAGAAGNGTYTLWHLDPNGSWISLRAATGRTFPGNDGVVQFDQHADAPWPGTFSGVSVSARQYESNVVTDVALRSDSASTSLWSQPC
jgi:hypothetical protein